MKLDSIDGGRGEKHRCLGEIKAEMKQITNKMFSLAWAGIKVDDGVIVPCSPNGLNELTKVLTCLMNERIDLEKPKGLIEIKAKIKALLSCKDRIESGELNAPKPIMALVESSLMSLIKEQADLEDQLADKPAH